MGFSYLKVLLLGFIVLGCLSSETTEGALPKKVLRRIREINDKGPYLGLVVPNSFEMGPVIVRYPTFAEDRKLPVLDISGRRFRIGNLINRRVIMVMTGLGMLNAGIATEILLSLFNVNGVIHFGIAGNANPNLQIGDVVIPKYWAHTGLLNWQRYGDTPDNLLSLEGNGDYTRKLGYLQFSDYSSDHRKNDNSSKNLLNRVWYQPEETFLTNGVAEERSHAFWVPVNNHFYEVAKIMEGATLSNCWEKHCLSKAPIVAMVDRGSSSNIFVDNAAYRKFLSAKFNVTPIDMESAAVALVCHQQRIPFIAFRALSDLAGGGPFQSNEADIFAPLAAENAVKVVFRFIALLSR